MNENMIENTELHNEGQEQEVKTYTQEEVNALLQREADRRVSGALAKQKKEYEKKLSLASLDENQRAVAEKDNRITELEEQLKEFKVIQAKNEVINVLAARGLSPQFADLIAIDDDIEAAQSRIETLDTLFKKSVQEEVKRRLATPSPKIGGNEGEMNSDRFKKMSLKERQDLYTQNPDLYKKLSGK